MKKYKATIQWHHQSDRKGILRYDYVEYQAPSFTDALKVAEAHLITLPNAQLVRLETI